MTKRRITHRQRYRIQKLQARRLQRAQEKLATTNEDENLNDVEAQAGTLIAHYGVYIDVEDANGKLYRCNIRQNLGPMVAGDIVIFCPGKDSSGVIVAIEPRKSLLAKPGSDKRLKPIAANIDQIIIVIAPSPAPVLSLVDSYLVAAETVQIKPILLLNKIDLLDKAAKQYLQQLLNIYGNLGYAVYTSSNVTSTGLKQLKTALTDHTSILVGQSGVGKSSLINHLIPGAKLPTGELSKQSQHGVHTTITSQLYHLNFGGDIIDSPGIREFGLWHMEPAEISKGFVEIQDHANQCKFRNCSHTQEPECAVLAAVASGLIAESRLQSYYALLDTITDNKSK